MYKVRSKSAAESIKGKKFTNSQKGAEEKLYFVLWSSWTESVNGKWNDISSKWGTESSHSHCIQGTLQTGYPRSQACSFHYIPSKAQIWLQTINYNLHKPQISSRKQGRPTSCQDIPASLLFVSTIYDLSKHRHLKQKKSLQITTIQE